MKETIKTNLNQRLFDLDADAYERLKNYLDSLKAYFRASDQGANEILQDIEQRIAEILEGKLKAEKQVITSQDIEEVIKLMGTVEDFAGEPIPEENEPDGKASSRQSATFEDYSREHRKLYRDAENNILGGVCSGIAAYFNVDTVWIRLAFVVLFFINLVGLITYLILWVIVPPAITTAQKLQMRGRPVTVENIQESVASEFHKVKDNFKRYTQSENFRRTNDSAREILRTIGDIILVFLKIVLIILGVGLLIAVVALAFGILTVFLAGGNWHDWHFSGMFFREHLYPLFHDLSLFTLALVLVILIPAVALLTGIIKLIFGIHAHNNILTAFAWTFWTLALVFVIVSLLTGDHMLSFKQQKKEVTALDVDRKTTLYIRLQQEDKQGRDRDYYSILGKEIIRDKRAEICYVSPSFAIRSSGNEDANLTLIYRTAFPDFRDQLLYNVAYDWYMNDTILFLGEYLRFDEEDIWKFPDLHLVLYLPEGQQIQIDKGIEKIATRNPDENEWPAWYYDVPVKIESDKILSLGNLSE